MIYFVLLFIRLSGFHNLRIVFKKLIQVDFTHFICYFFNKNFYKFYCSIFGPTGSIKDLTFIIYFDLHFTRAQSHNQSCGFDKLNHVVFFILFLLYCLRLMTQVMGLTDSLWLFFMFFLISFFNIGLIKN